MENPISNEQILKKYTYTDNKTPNKNIIFECEAFDILEADKKYQEETKNNPNKQNHIGCSQEPINNEN
jgi:hypothetical protein